VLRDVAYAAVAVDDNTTKLVSSLLCFRDSSRLTILSNHSTKTAVFMFLSDIPLGIDAYDHSALLAPMLVVSSATFAAVHNRILR